MPEIPTLACGSNGSAAPGERGAEVSVPRVAQSQPPIASVLAVVEGVLAAGKGEGMASPDVVIIGGGISGTAAAYELARLGVP
ncbi:MAG: hypothetical protein KC442_01615, partial [Thermomicrobiales bacterium]|nr:hypothetical protein [Thermomicrobiales bacterium]